MTLDGKVAAAGRRRRAGSAVWTAAGRCTSCAPRSTRSWSAPAPCDATTRSSPSGSPRAATRCASWSRATATCRRARRSSRPRAARRRSWSPSRRRAPRAASSTTRGAELIEVGDGGLRGALAALAGRGLLDILCEGGPTLAGELLADGLIDRMLLFVAPLIVGRGAPDLFAAPAVDAVDHAWRLQDVEWRRVCDDLLLSGSLRRGES